MRAIMRYSQRNNSSTLIGGGEAMREAAVVSPNILMELSDELVTRVQLF